MLDFTDLLTVERGTPVTKPLPKRKSGLDFSDLLEVKPKVEKPSFVTKLKERFLPKKEVKPSTTRYSDWLKKRQQKKIKEGVKYPDLKSLIERLPEPTIPSAWESAEIPYIRKTLGLVTRPFGYQPYADLYTEEQIAKAKEAHPVATAIGEITGGIAPYLAVAPLFPQTLLGTAGTFGTVGGVRKLGQQKIEESLMAPRYKKVVDIAKEAGKEALFAPIWHYTRELKFIGRPFASALTKAGLRGVGSATLSKVFGADLASALKQGGIITALSLIFEAPALVKTSLGRGVIKEANRIAKEANLPEGKVAINVDILDQASLRTSLLKLVKGLTRLRGKRGIPQRPKLEVKPKFKGEGFKEYKAYQETLKAKEPLQPRKELLEFPLHPAPKGIEKILAPAELLEKPKPAELPKKAVEKPVSPPTEVPEVKPKPVEALKKVIEKVPEKEPAQVRLERLLSELGIEKGQKGIKEFRGILARAIQEGKTDEEIKEVLGPEVEEIKIPKTEPTKRGKLPTEASKQIKTLKENLKKVGKKQNQLQDYLTVVQVQDAQNYVNEILAREPKFNIEEKFDEGWSMGDFKDYFEKIKNKPKISKKTYSLPILKDYQTELKDKKNLFLNKPEKEREGIWSEEIEVIEREKEGLNKGIKVIEQLGGVEPESVYRLYQKEHSFKEIGKYLIGRLERGEVFDRIELVSEEKTKVPKAKYVEPDKLAKSVKFTYGQLAKQFDKLILTTYQHKKSFSDGKFMDFSEPPEGLMKIKKMNELEPAKVDKKQTKNNIDPIIKSATEKAKMAEVQSSEDKVVVKLAAGHYIQKIYYDYFRTHYPNAEFYYIPKPKKDALAGVAVRVDGKPQGVILEIKIEEPLRAEKIPKPTQKEAVKEVVTKKPTKRKPVPYTGSLLRNIIVSSKSMAEAQKTIKKKLGFDISISELKKLERQIKGGALPDVSDKIIQGVVDKIKQKHKTAGADYGIGSVADISPEDLKEGLSTIGAFKEGVGYTLEKLKHSLNLLEMPQNYLYAYEDSKPVAEGVIDSEVKLVRKEKAIDDLIGFLKKIKNKIRYEKVAQIIVEADKNNEEIKDIEELGLTSDERDVLLAFQKLRTVVKNQLIEEIMNSRFGIRLKSNGIKYTVRYIKADGNFAEKEWISEKQMQNLQQKYSDLEVLDAKEEVVFKRLDPETGKYVSEKRLVKDYDEALDILEKEQRDLIHQILPYVAWIPHSRRGGRYWVEAFEPLVSGETETKIFSARIPNYQEAKAMAEALQKKFPAARVNIKPHSLKQKFMPSFGTMADVQYFLNKNGVDPSSEQGQRIVNAYRSMSPLMSHLIHRQNIAGYRVDYDGIVESMDRSVRAALHRSFRLDIKDLRDKLNDITDDFRYNVAFNYLDALSSANPGNSLLDGAKAMTYFYLLANKMTYIIQNCSEPIWAIAAASEEITNPLRLGKALLTPLGKEYLKLYKQAQNEGILAPFFEREVVQENIFGKLDIFGRASERFSSTKVFEIGLKLAKAKGLKDQEAYRYAYQFLFNKGKPFYHQANKPNVTVRPGGQLIRRYGFILANWFIDWINKFARATGQRKLWALLGYIFLAGIGGLPFGRRLLRWLGWINFRKNPKYLTYREKILIGGFLAGFGLDTKFLQPVFARGMKEMFEIGAVTRSFIIYSSKLKSAQKAYQRYGILGMVSNLPLVGLQWPLGGYLKVTKGVKEKRGRRFKTIYKPRTFTEKLWTRMGLTPLELGEYYQRRREK